MEDLTHEPRRKRGPKPGTPKTPEHPKEHFERILRERHPDGWQYLLMDAGVLYRCYDAIMTCKGEKR